MSDESPRKRERPPRQKMPEQAPEDRIRNFDEVVELDCAYLANWRFLDDLKIIIKTVLVVIQRKGAA